MDYEEYGTDQDDLACGRTKVLCVTLRGRLRQRERCNQEYANDIDVNTSG